MTSQDVIHSFYMPALRHQAGRRCRAATRRSGSTPTRPGEYRLHLRRVLRHRPLGDGRPARRRWRPRTTQRWLGAGRHRPDARRRRAQRCSAATAAAAATAPARPCTRRRSTAFRQPGAARRRRGRRPPTSSYIRDSILLPQKQVAAGYQPIMPSFQNQLGEDDVLKLVAYIKSLTPTRPEARSDRPRRAAPWPTLRERASYLGAGHTLRSWLLTTDHKRIAILYLDLDHRSSSSSAASPPALIRLDLAHARRRPSDQRGYNRAFTLHGVIMVWFFLIPSIPTTFGNFLIPLMIGARDLAFPRLNLLSWYIYMLGGAVHALRAASPAASTPAGPSTRRSRRCSRTATSWPRPSACSSSASPRSSPASTSSSRCTSCAARA